LNNAYSVHRESIGTRQKYKYFNAVFDEIELYFHPDLQRKFINDLLVTLRNNKHLHQSDLLSDINIIFSTHSPFILSDLPRKNVLQLEYSYSDQTDDGMRYSIPKYSKGESFAANIYDLLKDDFFLNEGVIGEFAKNKIQDILKKGEKTSEEITKKDIEVLELIGDPLLRRVALDKGYGKMKDSSLIKAQIEKLQKQLKSDDHAAD
jgi:hypothetical protein